MRRFKWLVSFLFLLLVFAFLKMDTWALELPKWFIFSSERSLDEWENKIFKGRVIYEVRRQYPESFLHALSQGSASAIFYRLKERFKAEDRPMISWKWKVIKFPDKEKIRTRQGIEKDDYAARVYVIFPSIFFLSSKALEYVWDETAPEGTICTSPYSQSIKLIVVHTGKDESGKWVFEERNIFNDYQKAFGHKPGLKVGAVALMSDADNTQDVSEAYFNDIKVGYKKER
ncbi:MAG: DUF3047 domain-containing protein [Candidatus Omnitrophota bacterium]